MAVYTLGRLVETLGRAFVAVPSGSTSLAVEVHDVVVHDLLDPVDVKEGDLILGVSLGPGVETAQIVADLASKRAAGLVLKGPALSDSAILEAAEDVGLPILSVPAGASWSQIAQLVQSLLAHSRTHAEDVDGLGAADLFTLADAVADLVDAPVTIEDPLSRVLAYSGRQDEADALRAETIIGREVPQRLLRRLNQEGLLRRLSEEHGCIYLDALDESTLPRLAVAIRAGDELLGSMWAAVRERPSPEVERSFAETAKLAALHLLRHRAGADVERTLQADLLASVLEGTTGAEEAAIRLGLTGPSYRVLASWIATGDEAEETRRRTQFRDVLAVHLSTFRVRGAVALLGGIVYAVVSSDLDVKASRKLGYRIARDLVARPGHHPPPAIGIGGAATRLAEIPRSKREAEEALRVVRGDPKRKVASIEEARLPALLARFTEAASTDRDVYDRKIAPLLESDASGQTAYVESLRAYFNAFGDYTEAAARLHIHPNTLRYRLRRAQELAGVQLDDPDERLALMLLIRLIPPATFA